jgi:hypothetical protein
MIRYLFGLSVILLASPSLWAQEEPSSYFTGVITYDIQFKGNAADVEFIKANEPNDELTLTVGTGDYIVHVDGGKYPKTFMFIADSNYEYSIDIQGQRAFRNSAYADLNRDTSEVEPVAKPTGRTKPVGDYTCQEYRMETKDAVIFYYVTEAFRIDLGAYPDRPNSKAMFLAKGLEGHLPLRMVRRTANMAVETSLVSIEPQTFYDEAFTIPQDFTVKGRDVRY